MELNFMLIAAIIMMIIIIPIMMSKNNREAFRHKSDIIIEEAMRVGRTAAGTLVGTRYLPGEPGHDNPLDRESRWLGPMFMRYTAKSTTVA